MSRSADSKGPAMTWASRFTTVKVSTDGVEEAFFTVLLGAALADGKQDPLEEEEIYALLHRLMGDEEDPQKSAEMRGRVRVRIQARDMSGQTTVDFRIIEEACRLLVRAKLGESSFANAADIIFADRKVVTEEVAYLQTLQGYLGIAEQRADQIIEVIQIKNRPQDVFG
jgi:hypothetical protein